VINTSYISANVDRVVCTEISVLHLLRSKLTKANKRFLCKRENLLIDGKQCGINFDKILFGTSNVCALRDEDEYQAMVE